MLGWVQHKPWGYRWCFRTTRDTTAKRISQAEPTSRSQERPPWALATTRRRGLMSQGKLTPWSRSSNGSDNCSCFLILVRTSDICMCACDHWTIISPLLIWLDFAELGDTFNDALFFVGEIGVNDYKNLLSMDGKSVDYARCFVPSIVQGIGSAIDVKPIDLVLISIH